jgi:hypothetical protein
MCWYFKSNVWSKEYNIIEHTASEVLHLFPVVTRYFRYVRTYVYKFSYNNLLTLSLNKTNLVHFAAKPTVNIPDYIELGQNRLINLQIINFLGLTLDYTLSWSPHIARICNKLRSAYYILRILKPALTAQNLKMSYFAYLSCLMVLCFGGTLLIMI